MNSIKGMKEKTTKYSIQIRSDVMRERKIGFEQQITGNSMEREMFFDRHVFTDLKEDPHRGQKKIVVMEL